MPKYRARIRDVDAWCCKQAVEPPGWIGLALVKGELATVPEGLKVARTGAIAFPGDWLVQGPLGIEVWKPHLFALHFVVAP